MIAVTRMGSFAVGVNERHATLLRSSNQVVKHNFGSGSLLTNIRRDPGWLDRVFIPSPRGAHIHPIDEHITVVKGTWSLGIGRRFNQSALELMETGTYGMAPKNM